MVLTAVFLGLTAVRDAATWPLAAWFAFQLAVLRMFDGLPAGLETEVRLAVALVGLAVALVARRGVARTVLVTTAPWWLSGVLAGSGGAWTGGTGAQWAAAALTVAAAAGLLLVRLRAVLDPLLGPPVLVPLLSGVVAGAAVTGAMSSLGTEAVVGAGYLGVWTANLAALLLNGWKRGLLLPVAAAAGATMSLLCVVRLAEDARWPALSLLFLLTAVPTLVVAVWRSDDRPVAVPTAVGCGAAAVLFALPRGPLDAGSAAIALTSLYALAMGIGSELEPGTRRSTAVVAAGSAAAGLLVLAAQGDRFLLAAHLAVQGLCTLAWARRSDRLAEPVLGVPPTDPEETAAAWRIGAGQLVVAAWVAAAAADRVLVEAYTLPLAAGLLLAAGPRLMEGRSWPAWGPALLVAAVPSTVLAVVPPDPGRAVAVLVAAAVAMVAGARSGVRAPLLVGAVSALAVPLGLAVRALPWPIAAAVLVGAALLAVGVRRELRPVAGFGARLADLR
jgi:hypothetical protein